MVQGLFAEWLETAAGFSFFDRWVTHCAQVCLKVGSLTGEEDSEWSMAHRGGDAAQGLTQKLPWLHGGCGSTDWLLTTASV